MTTEQCSRGRRMAGAQPAMLTLGRVCPGPLQAPGSLHTPTDRQPPGTLNTLG